MSHFIGNKGEVQRLQALDNKANRLPAKGKHIGGGRHVPMTNNPQSPGWTRHRFDFREHPTTKNLFAIMVVEMSEDGLTPGEVLEIRAAKAVATPLTPDWEPAAP